MRCSGREPERRLHARLDGVRPVRAAEVRPVRAVQVEGVPTRRPDEDVLLSVELVSFSAVALVLSVA